jgi:hypothetical protein
MQGRKLAYKKSKNSKHTKEKTTHKTMDIQKYGKKKIIYSKNIPLYNPQWDKVLNTSKKESKK